MAVADPGWKWAFLETLDVHPIVEEAFSEDIRLRRRYRIDEARACKGLADWGHPLVEWADYLSNAVYRSHRGRGNLDINQLESWARELLEAPSPVSMYDDQIERLSHLACVSASGHAWQVVDELARKPDVCSDRGPRSLADRCRASDR